MNPIHYHFPEGYVSDKLFNILHETYREFGENSPSFIVIGGSFSLNVQKAINRRVSDLDICVSRWHYNDVVSFMSSKIEIWFEKEEESADPTFTAFKLKDSNSRICLFKHESFDKVKIKTMQLHGRLVSLFPAAETVDYKLKFLEESPAWTPQHEIAKHFADALSYVRTDGSSKEVVDKFTALVLRLRSYSRLSPEIESLLTNDELEIIEKHHSKTSTNTLDTQLYK